MPKIRKILPVEVGKQFATNVSALGIGAYFSNSYAQAFIDAAGITDGTQQTAIEELVDDLVSYGLWDKLDIFYPFVGGDATKHSYNLIDPTTYQLTFYGGWTHALTGVLGNGTNSYADGAIVLNVMTNYVQNSNHQGWYVRNSGNDNGYNGVGVNYLGGWGGDAQTRVSGGGSMSVTTGRNGNFLGTRRGNTDSEYYKDGVSIATDSGASATLPSTSYEYELGALHSSGAARSYYHSKEMTYFSLGGGLTDTEAADFDTVISNYNTALSR